MHAVAFSMIAGAHHAGVVSCAHPASSLIALSRVVLGLLSYRCDCRRPDRRVRRVLVAGVIARGFCFGIRVRTFASQFFSGRDRSRRAFESLDSGSVARFGLFSMPFTKTSSDFCAHPQPCLL